MDVITTHVNADFDCLGAMVAARRLYPEAEMVFAGSQEKSLREFFLRSAVYAFGIKRVRDIDLKQVTRLILVDVRQSDRIGPFEEVARRPGVELHIYDHHPEGQADLRGSVEQIEPVGATVTVLSHLFMERGIDPTPEEATVMMLGLYEDTGSLLFSSTTGRDYQAAAFLLSRGANLNVVADFLVQELTSAQVALLHSLIESRSYLNVHGIDVCIAHAAIDHYVADLAVLAHKLKDMENLDVLIVAVRMGDRIFLVGRSRLPEVHVGEILGEFGGGGHAFAAAGTVRDLTLVQVLDRLPEVLRRHVRPALDAGRLMSTPAKAIPRATSIARAREFLTRYNISAAPVVEAEKVVGLISRQVVERAAHHGLGDLPVSEYMFADPSTATPATAIDELQELIVDRNQRLVPVLDDGRLVGVVSRTDLLRHLAAGARQTRRVLAEEPSAQTLTLKRKDIARLMKERLPGPILAMLREMGEVGASLGLKVYAVGGFLRDLLLQKENLDVDIVVEGDGIAFAVEYARRTDSRVRTHRKFGTAVIIFPDGFKVDVASTRREYYLAPGALPTVEGASLRHDLYRRDFTINTLALSLDGERFGELLDFFGAQRDLREQAIRVLHNLSFVEDPTRMFRAVRFEQRLDFRLGMQTEQLLKSAVRMGFLERVRGPRLFNELSIILKEHAPFRAAARMAELDLLKCIHPALKVRETTGRLFDQADRALHWHDLLYTGKECRRWVVYSLCLFESLDHDALTGVCARLQIPTRYRGLYLGEREEAHRTLSVMERRAARKRPPRASEIHGWLQGFSEEILLYLMARTVREEVRRWVSQFITHLREVRPALGGKDLLALGLVPGPVLKEVLAELLAARLDGKVGSRSEEEALVRKKHMSSPSRRR